MLMMEVETDPLQSEDPLACTNEDHKSNEDQSEWIIKLEPQIVSEIGRDESENEGKEGIKLRRRKPSKIAFPDVEDGSDLEWDPSSKTEKAKKKIRPVPKRKKKRKKITQDDSDSNEENTVPPVNKKRNRKRENYLKKYRQLKEKRGYVCKVCKKTFITASHLKEHVLSHCQIFPCVECDKVFSHQRSLQRHVANGHNPDANNEENERDEENGDDNEEDESSNSQKKEASAGDKIERSKNYYEQLKTERKYQCEVCQKTFITSGHLSTHMYCHSGKKWTCDGCGKNFSCERSLIRHKDTFPGEHWFPCQLCDMTFFRLLNIAKHMEIKHPEASADGKRPAETEEEATEKIYVCKKCYKTFYSLESLKVHKQAMHFMKKEEEGEEDEEEGEELKDSAVFNYAPKYKCDICSKQFISLEGFEYHKNHQHVEKDPKKKKKKKSESEDEGETANFVCKICSASFPLKSTLQTHLKTHNVTKNIEVKTGSHQCCICPRSFTSSDGLKYHLATHTGERRYSCGQCGKRFIKKTHLSEHIATHSEVKYFKCSRCPRTFSTHSAYRKHIKHFPGPHSFPCTQCGKLFTKESMIEKHMCVDLVKITMAPEVKALLSEDMIEEYLCLAEEQEQEELARKNQNQNQNDPDNSSHSCYKCFKIFPSLASLQAHQNDHIGKQNYQCRFCPENFKRADAFGSHIRNHLGSTPYMCLKCNRKFISPFTLSMHAKNYPGDHSFTCQKCRRWFPSEKRLEKHDCILQNSDVFVCACGSCFKSWNELLEHAGTKPYKCCSCELKYPTLMALARHIKKHTGVKPFSCEVCGKSFRAKNNYLNHKNIHKEAKEIQCEHCDYKSKSQKRMDFHLFRKHDIGSNTAKSMLCPVCGIMFPYLSHMKKHVETEHPQDYHELMLDEPDDEKKPLPAELCTLCGKLLNNKYTLANHMKKVHNPTEPKKERELKCEICGEKFRTNKRLQRHAEVHEAPGLRICEICNKEFYFAKDLRKHMRKHDTNKPYSCSRCGKHFKVSVSLKYHSTICGNVSQRNNGGRKKKEEEEVVKQNDILYGHIEPLDLNNRPYTLQLYRR